ncbi:MAG: HYR domain-containing protein [Bacteroidota bacterium]
MVSITAAQIDDGSTDACGIANYAVSPSTFTCANVGANTVTLTVTDNNGNSSSCTATVMIVDNNPPTALCQPHTVTLDANGNGSMTAADIDGGSSDNCGIATVVASQTAFTCADAAVSPVPVTLTVTDVNGNVSTCVAQVSVQDVTNPVITCPAAITVSADPGQCTAVVTSLGLATATDECGIASIVNDFNANGADANGTYNVGTRNVTFLATDNNGNVATCVVAVTVEDNELPTITCNGDITVSNFPGLCTAPVPYVVIANDNCPGFTVAQTAGLASGAQFPVGTTTNTFVVTDASGNTATCSFDVTVEDNQSPSIICPPDLVVNNDPGICGAVINYTPPMGVDNCPLPANATQLTSGPAPGATFPVGITTVEYTVTDAVGQTAVCTFDVTVNDNENPVFTGCPNNITVGNDLGACGANVNWIPPVGSDNCSATITASHNPGDFFPVGTTVVSYTATDAAGNVGVCTFNVTVNDTELPTITCPANIVVGTDPGQCDAVVNYSVTGNDNCPGFNISQTAGLASGATFPLGATTVTYEITDAAGNTANCSFIVTVNDTENPALTCPANITVNNTPGLCEAVVTYAAPVGTDNCPGVSTALFNGLASGSAFPVGVNTVTYRATDAAGNTTDCFFTVTVIDNEDPTIVCSIPVLQTADPGVCGANVTFSAPVTADNCPGEGVSLISGIPNGGFFPVGTTTNTYRVTDASGNTADCSFTITITDDEDPVVTCPADIVQSNDAGVCEANVTVPNPTITDNCPGPFTITNDYNNTNDASDIYPVGITTVTFTITDPAGNTTTCSMNVTVEDTENPTILCPFPSQIALNGAGIVDLSQLPFFNQSVDNCGPVTISFAPKTIYDCSDAGTTTVITITATDGAGNTNSCITALTVVDNVSPTVNCPANITTPVDPGLCSAVVTYAAPTFSDNCPGSTIVQTAGLISGSIFPVGVTTNSFEVTDAVGNVSVCSFDVTVVDSENPTITCPANIVQANDAGLCSAVITYAVGFGDNCPGATLTQTAGLPSGSAFPVGTTTNTFVVTDLVGNSVTCSFDVTINDTEDPVITCPADITVQATTGLCEAVVNYTIPTVTDNCVPSPIPTLTGGLGSGAAFPVGTTTETYSFTDPSGNTVSCSFTVTVEDNVAPALTCPANITVNNDAGLCGAVVSWTVPTPVDNCAGSAIAGYTLLGSFAGNDYYISNTPSDWATASLAAQATGGHLAVIETAAENAFIAGAIGADLHWIGYTDAAVEGTFEWVTGIQSAFESWTPGEPNDFGGVEDHAAIFNNGLWLDLDGTSARLSILEIGTSQLNSPAPGSLFPVGTTTVSYQAVDVNGNVATCSFDVTVLDVEDPTIACPANITVNNDPGDCGAVVTYADPTTTDNCPGETVTQTAGLASGMSFPVGTTTNTFVVTDASGNTATCSFDVTVNDTEAPTIVCPTAVIVNNDPGLCSAVVTYAMPVSADNCPGITVVQTAGLPSGSVFLVGTTTNTFVVTDAAGLTATCSFDVTVNDTENPTIVCPANITQSVDPGSCDAVVTYTPPVGTDNCNSTTVLTTAGFGSGATFPLGTTTVTYTVTDASGNTASCSFDVTIVDQDPPTINCPADITVSAPMGTCDAVVTYAAVTATDGCPGIGAVVQTAGLASGSTFPVGVTTNTFEVTDAAGNTSTCSFDVTVEDNEDPVITCPADITVFANGGQCTALVNYTGASATDNCGIPTVNLISGLGSGGSFPVGVNTETYQAVDASGNTATCSFTITVVDNQDPTITCPADIVMGNDPGVCGATVTFADPTFNDNCPGSILTQTAGQASGTVFPIGTTTNTFVITDPSGNTATCSFDVTVNDTEAPVISCPANITVTAGPGLCDEIVIYPGVTATDNCPGAPTISLIAGLSSGANFPVGITTVTYEAEDAIGNISTCSFTVNVLAAVPITQATINTPVNAITMAAELCEDEDLTLSASVPNAGTGEVGTWSFVGTAPASFTFLPDANDPNAVLSGITASPPVYELEWAITDGCITTRDTILIQVNPKPSGVILETMPISAFGASDGELLALPLSGTPGYFFQWDNAPANSTTPSISGLATGTYTVVISDTKGCDDTLSYFLDQPAAQTVLVSPKVILGGAVDIITGEMNDNLRGLADFPLTEPYTAAGFPALNAGSSLTTNAGVLSVTGSDAIVDWILVEIRDKTDRSVLLGRQPALLQADGDIVDAGDGVSPVAIIGTPDDYYVAIRHRNHLGVMSDAVLSLNDATTTLADFTDGSVVAYQLPLANALSRAPLQVLSGPAFATTTFGLWGGDSNGDKVVTYAGATSDLSPVSIKVLTDLGNPTFSLTYQVPGYNIEDLNMDGLVTYAGSATEITVITINVLLHPDNVSPPFSLSFQIYEQIP